MNTNKGFAPIIAIIIAVVIIAGGIGGYLYIKNKNTLPIVIPSNTLTTTVVTTTSTVVTATSTDVVASWKTYTNTQYGFEIKYPNDWSHGSDVMSEYFVKSFNENSADFSCIFGIAVITNSDYLKTVYPNNKRVNVNIGSISAVKIEGLSDESNYGDYLIEGDNQNNSFEITENINKIIINKNGDKVSLGTVNNQGCINTFNQILSTFKFINYSPTTTEKASGIIKSVYSKSGKNYLDIDYIELNPNWAPGGMTGAAYQNNNPQIRTFEISPSVKIFSANAENNFMTFLDFKNYFVSDSSNYQKYNPWDIVVTNGVITQITEHFLP